jgi:hypothetical protein
VLKISDTLASRRYIKCDLHFQKPLFNETELNLRSTFSVKLCV